MSFKDYSPNQLHLYGYRPEDVLGDDDPAYILAEVLSKVDISGFHRQGEGAGQPPYHPAMMLAILLYGMMRGVFSSRALAAECRRDMGFIYLSCGQRPCFKTICNFRNNHGPEIRAMMGQVLGLLRDLGVGAAGRLVLDSTRLRANANRDKMIRADNYDIALRQIDNYLTEGRKRDSDDDDCFGPGGDPNVLPKSLRNRKDLLRKLEQAIRSARESGRKAVSPNDPECNQMRENHSGRIRPGYALQAGIDKDSGLLTVCDAAAAPTDNGFATEAVRQHEENVGKAPLSLDADSGYFNAAELSALEGSGINICIPDSETARAMRKGANAEGVEQEPAPKERFGINDFNPVAERDAWLCPGGRVLEREGGHKSRGRTHFTYRAPDSCDGCSLSSKCLRPSDRGRRRLEVWEHHMFVVSNRERFADPLHFKRYRRRGSHIERIFGHLRRNLRFRQWLHSGLEKVRTTAALFGIAHNILVLARSRKKPVVGQEVAAALSPVGWAMLCIQAA